MPLRRWRSAGVRSKTASTCCSGTTVESESTLPARRSTRSSVDSNGLVFETELPARAAQRRGHLVEADLVGQLAFDQQIEHHVEHFGEFWIDPRQVIPDRGTGFERPEPLVHHRRSLGGQALLEIDGEQAL